MELELRLHPDDAARLPRLRCLAQAVQGRPRVHRHRVIWHDDPQRRLAAEGLVLAQQREGWCLSRLLPDGMLWPPGAPAPVLERAAEPGGFDHQMPVPLAPVASFVGRLSSYAPVSDTAPVNVGLLRGTLRAVTDEQPVCRLLLSGDEPAVHDLALTIAEEVRLQVPDASLAGEAFAMAHGVPPPARHLGAPSLPREATIAEAFACVVGQLADVILHFAAAAADPRSDPEPVHQMRVAARRLRSCCKVFQPAVRSPAVERIDAAVKALGRQLAPVRDWDVFVTETAASLLQSVADDPRLNRLLRAADRRRGEHQARLRDFLQGAAFRQLGIELAWLAAARSWHEELDAAARETMQGDLTGFAAAMLQRRMDKLLRATEDIDSLDPAGLHRARLRAKRLRYAAETFAPLYAGKAARRFIHRLSRLQQDLGAANDATVAGSLMAELGGPGGRHGYAVGLVAGFAAARAGETRGRIMRAWEKFRRQAPFWE